MAKKKNGGNTTARRGKLTVKGYVEPAKKVGMFVLGVVTSVLGQQGYHQVRPTAVTPTSETGTKNKLIVYAEPAVIVGIGGAGYQMAKNSYWKTFWLGVMSYGGLKIFDQGLADVVTKKPILAGLSGIGDVAGAKQLPAPPKGPEPVRVWNNQGQSDNGAAAQYNDMVANAGRTVNAIA